MLAGYHTRWANTQAIFPAVLYKQANQFWKTILSLLVEIEHNPQEKADP
jgi:hypothetical protein